MAASDASDDTSHGSKQQHQDEDAKVMDRLSILSASLKDESTNASLATEAMQYWWSVEQEYWGDLMEQKVPEQVVTIIQNHNNNEQIVKEALKWMYNVVDYENVDNEYDTFSSPQRVVATLVEAMKNFPDNTSIQQSGTLVLLNLVHCGSYRDIFIEEGVVPVIFSAMKMLLESNKVENETFAAGGVAIIHLLDNDTDGGSFQNEIEQSGGIPLLLKVIEVYGSQTIGDEMLQLSSLLWSITALAEMLGHKRSFAEAEMYSNGGITTIVTVIQRYMGLQELQRQGFLAISNMMEGQERERCMDEFIAADGIDATLTAIKEHADHADVLAIALLIVHGLVTTRPFLADDIASTGGLDTLIEILSCENAQIMYFTCGILYMCLLHESKQVLDALCSNQSVVSSLLDAMRKHPEFKELHRAANAILCRVTITLEICKGLVKKEGLRVLLQSMQQFSSDVDVQRGVVKTIGNIGWQGVHAKDTRMLDALVSTSYVPSLVSILSNHDGDEWLLLRTVACLHMLADTDDGVKRQIIDAGGVTKLASLTRKSQGETAQEAQRLLDELMRYSLAAEIPIPGVAVFRHSQRSGAPVSGV